MIRDSRQWLHPITRKRLRRFRGLRRAWWSFLILGAAYVVSLGAELLANDKPLHVRFEGRHLFPVLRYYSERDVLGVGHDTRADFKAIEASERFRDGAGNRMAWPLIRHGPREIITMESIALPDEVRVRAAPEPRVATVDVDRDLRVLRGMAAGHFFGGADGSEIGRLLQEAWTLSEDAVSGLQARLRNEAAPAVVGKARNAEGREIEAALAPFQPRSAAPRTVRLTLREQVSEPARQEVLVLAGGTNLPALLPSWWGRIATPDQAAILALARERRERPVDPLTVLVEGERWRVRFDREDVRFPFRPVAGHPLGIDGAGRDVAARLIYGLRTSMTFGMILVVASMLMGTLVGAAQGYHGGAVDLVGQRLTEIWDSLPFLYILMLMGSVYGRSFGLLLVCYGLFNWIGISIYMRGEFLRLRHQTYVEAARALGLPSWKIMYRHILPNALVPLVTFFPFSLVSAIGVLAALDYLGFGLPPPTPSWGEMLAQAQEHNWAWWLTLYPSLALFSVMLLGVFVGEGVRSAFDPKPYSRME
jgi:microcin C transport system permease protein